MDQLLALEYEALTLTVLPLVTSSPEIDAVLVTVDTVIAAFLMV